MAVQIHAVVKFWNYATCFTDVLIHLLNSPSQLELLRSSGLMEPAHIGVYRYWMLFNMILFLLWTTSGVWPLKIPSSPTTPGTSCLKDFYFLREWLRPLAYKADVQKWSFSGLFGFTCHMLEVFSSLLLQKWAHFLSYCVCNINHRTV